MGFLDSSVVSAVLAANPAIRLRLRGIVSRLSNNGFSESELQQVEREIVHALKLRDARKLPTFVPSKSEPLKLNAEQLHVVQSTIGRFRDARLRQKCLVVVSSAISCGTIVKA